LRTENESASLLSADIKVFSQFHYGLGLSASAAATVSLSACTKVLFATEARVSRLAAMVVLSAALMALRLAMMSMGWITYGGPYVALYETVTQTGCLMFYTEAASSRNWSLIVIGLALRAVNYAFMYLYAHSHGLPVALLPSSGDQAAAGGLARAVLFLRTLALLVVFAAGLRQVDKARLFALPERKAFRFVSALMLLAHLSYSPPIYNVLISHWSGDIARLTVTILGLIQICIGPMIIVQLVALTQAAERSVQKLMAAADRRVKEAEKAAEARRQFLRFTFHEVRVPFQSIILGLEALPALQSLDGPFSDVRADLHLMRAAADCMNVS
jgi:signal transduction histidine kinase